MYIPFFIGVLSATFRLRKQRLNVAALFLPGEVQYFNDLPARKSWISWQGNKFHTVVACINTLIYTEVLIYHIWNLH